MGFKDLTEFLDEDEPLVLPVAGKEYTFPGAISASAWLQLQKITYLQQARSEGDEVADDESVSFAEQRALERELYGDVEARMIADGCTSTQVKAVLATATVFYLQGRAFAEAFWMTQGWALSGEPPAPNRATRRSQGKGRATPSTRSRGSAAGTTPPKNPSKKAPSGRTSSSTGT